MRISDWSSDVCSSDLFTLKHPINAADRTTSDRNQGPEVANVRDLLRIRDLRISFVLPEGRLEAVRGVSFRVPAGKTVALVGESGSGKSVVSQAIMGILRSEEHTSELQSLMRITYAVICSKKKKN